MKRARFSSGSVVLDRRRKTWNLLKWVDGKRTSSRIGTLREYPNKSAAQRAVLSVPSAQVQKEQAKSPLAVERLIVQYRNEKMPNRIKTRQGYETWFKHYIVPKWGEVGLPDLQARPVELWLDSLRLAPKSKVHIRALIGAIWEFAMWSGAIPVQRNPMELVTIEGGSKRITKPRSLTIEEFQKFVAKLTEPFRLFALLSACYGLRISEALALQWCDINWLEGTLRIERRICSQIVDTPKSAESQRTMVIDSAMLKRLKIWKQTTQFVEPTDWIFASPVQVGRLPFCYAQVWNVYHQAGKDAGIGHVSSHVLRHSYRAWLDSTGAKLTTQRKLMRHTDIRTTLNYGDTVTTEMLQAGTKVVQLALNGLPADCKPC